MSTTTYPTNDEIDRAILNALADTGEELVPWAALRQRVPGNSGRKGEAFVRLWSEGSIWAIKIQGRNYLALGDEHDARIAAKAKEEGRVRELRCL
jgi:hypothetical protein